MLDHEKKKQKIYSSFLYIRNPQSIWTTEPVMQLESSEPRKTAIFEISSDSPIRSREIKKIVYTNVIFGERTLYVSKFVQEKQLSLFDIILSKPKNHGC